MQSNTLTYPIWQVMFWAESSQCNSPLFNGVAWQVEVPAGQVNLRGSLPHLASNVLVPMLQPENIYIEHRVLMYRLMLIGELALLLNPRNIG